ncbi:hypothetical protein [Stackebrandtia soli]|uniref:hypothetical protein n=1 Tax=Stackebrandtia soli TaxID=1892856 RepID=UPI0039E8759A
MATSAYRAWVRAGRPWKKAGPIADLEKYAQRHGIAVLGTLGNTAHLTASFPEDHTPFSYTAWPKRLSGYVVTAIDLANSRGLGAAILRDARAGRLPWLKYLNTNGRHYNHSDRFRSSRPSNDHHVHVSIRTDHLTTDITDYDPLGLDMDLSDRVTLPEWVRENHPELDETISVRTALASGYGHARSAKDAVHGQVLPALAALAETVSAIRADLDALAETLRNPTD